LLPAWFLLVAVNTIVFIDGFSGMGFRRYTTAVKVSEIPSQEEIDAGYTEAPGVDAVMEWRGDETFLGSWLCS
jgi:hypothetical protein